MLSGIWILSVWTSSEKLDMRVCHRRRIRVGVGLVLVALVRLLSSSSGFCCDPCRRRFVFLAVAVAAGRAGRGGERPGSCC